MYLLFVDESGTHGGSEVFVLGGIAVHEDDAQPLQHALDDVVIKHLGRVPPNLDQYELHGRELRNAKRSTRAQGVDSVWAGVPRATRLDLLADAYDVIVDFAPSDPSQPVMLFGIAVDANFRAHRAQIGRERFAYEVLLNKFDLMLKKLRVEHDRRNRGLVIHDRRVVAEQDIQAWTSQWRAAAGDIGQLLNLADVPLFADSRATRLLQAADLVSYSIYRRYAPDVADPRNFDKLWSLFHRDDAGMTHGCVHFTPSYGQGSCACPPCEQRLLAEATGAAHRGSRRS